MKPRTNANERELLLKEEVYAVVGCAAVLKVRGHGFHERIHENGLCVEFRLRGLEFAQQQRH